MQLGFVSAILPELSLDEVLEIAARYDYDCVELCCWPKGKAERRYAGVTHIEVEDFGAAEADQVKALVNKHGVQISGLGYYPNPLAPDAGRGRHCAGTHPQGDRCCRHTRRQSHEHLRRT